MTDAISKKIAGYMQKGSWIRRMFEEGDVLKAKFGKDNVFDFSLGNPMGEPPAAFKQAIRDALDDPAPGQHGYMPNAGYPHVRNKLAEVLSRDHGVSLSGKDLIMTVGAAGAMNVALKAILNPGDKVMIFAPYFVEYVFYADNAGGQVVVVETDADFNLNPAAIEAAMEPSVRALIINTPNNPTGRIYSMDVLQDVGAIVDRKSKEYGRPIYILSDEPYKRITYGIDPPSLFHISTNTLVCTSYSKELVIPGERLGYVAVNPVCGNREEIINALTFCNRILGFVNAPALMQRALYRDPDDRVSIEGYRTNRQLLLDGLGSMGYEIVPPEGAFYLFPKSPIEDEVAFTEELKKENILVVPGRGFGRAGYFRISYCVTQELIQRSLPGFKRAIDRVN
ncbi:pyridoxal phosphate-dependent aminotransferase [bacterium]|nr:pyridoxal phosphate-dependent aminotransferase [candidate division CSSED10-310 bacterium]